MRLHLLVDGRGGGPQCLSDDVSAVQTTPRILTSGTDEGVDTMGIEFEQLTNGHGIRVQLP
mgnify:CR=1 FL=1